MRHVSTGLHGVEVTIDRGQDGVPVVFVDTPRVEDAEYGPRIRIRLNDELVWGVELDEGAS